MAQEPAPQPWAARQYDAAQPSKSLRVTAPLRFHALDSLRGLAALSVVFYHLMLFWPNAPWRLFAHTPLLLATAGVEAVRLFFVLSGFVLAYQLSTNTVRFQDYCAKRVCRIYLPYLAAICTGLLASAAWSGRTITWLPASVQSYWHDPVTLKSVIACLLFVGPTAVPEIRIDPAVWSLVYEMRISLLIPALVWTMQRVSAGPVLLASLALSIGVGVLVTPSDAGLVQPVVAANWLPTLHFLFMFACGAALALRRTPVETWLNGPGRRAIVLTLSCSAYFEAMLITHRLGVGENVFFFDWLVTAGATGIIACALGRNAVSRVLDIAPLRFLGDISYSMYLFHFLLIDAVAHALGPYSTYPRTAAVSLVLVVPVSLLANRLFEKPAMRLAAHITKARIRRVANMEVIAEAVEAKNQQPLAR